MPENQNIRFAIAGLGHIGQRHLANILAHPACALAATCDPDPAARPNPKTPHFQDLGELLATGPDFDILAICTPNGLHARHAIAALDAGRHVLVEKPLALRRTDCESMIFKALERDRKLFVVMQNRYAAAARWLREMVSGGFLGQVFLLEINCYWNRDDRYYFRPDGQKHPWRGDSDLDGGPLFTQFSHFIDLIFWIFGPLTLTAAQFENHRHRHATPLEDTGFVLFKTPDGATGRLTYTTAARPETIESSIRVFGARGDVGISGQYFERVDFAHVEAPETCPVFQTTSDNAQNHAKVLQNVVEVLSGQTPIGTNALEGMRVVEFIENAYALKR